MDLQARFLCGCILKVPLWLHDKAHTAVPFMQIFKENPTLKIKKWPRPPCLANRFSECSIDSIVQKLNSILGASVWDAEGCIELPISCVNRRSQPAAHTPPLFPCRLPETPSHLAAYKQGQGALCTESDICKGCRHFC